MNKELGPLIAGYFTAGIDGLALRRVDRGGPTAPGSADGPPLFVPDDMLIALGHVNLLKINKFTRRQPHFLVDASLAIGLQFQYIF
jgi:hypothetical protein